VKLIIIVIFGAILRNNNIFLPIKIKCWEWKGQVKVYMVERRVIQNHSKKTHKIEVVRRLTGISRRSFAALRYGK